ncbi:flavodoxin domain-containing protein [Thalassotalea piscium]
MENVLTIVVVISVWLLLCVAMWRVHLARQHSKVSPQTSLLIAYASQNGNAQAIANHCAKMLPELEKVSVSALNNISIEQLGEVDKVLFIVSTYGDGEAPDNGHIFSQHLQEGVTNSVTLEHLQYSVVALGDSSYPRFCAFGYQVHQLMSNLKANALNEVTTVDKYDEQLTSLNDIMPKWLNARDSLATPAVVKSTQYWQLTQRELLNPDCDDEALFQLNLTSVGPSPCWQAGDLIDIQPKHPEEHVNQWLAKHGFDGDYLFTHQGQQQPLRSWLATRELPSEGQYYFDDLLIKLPYLRKRSYSVASIVEQGSLTLIVRLLKKSNDTLGVASGYLSHHCPLGRIIEGQIRPIKAHHNINTKQPMILIGAGSGFAGIKAQIAKFTFINTNQGQQTGPLWLIFGERNSDAAHPINQQLASLEQTVLAKLSYAYSRDPHSPKYVQDILEDEQDMLKQWLQEGASIYVCGCLSGMGESVHKQLIHLLGEEMLNQLQLQHRYIRDVY